MAMAASRRASAPPRSRSTTWRYPAAGRALRRTAAGGPRAYRQACAKGPRVVRIRAILSWNVRAPCANPNHVPTWGNREETLIHIARPGRDPADRSRFWRHPRQHIDDVTGLTTATAKFATNNLPRRRRSAGRAPSAARHRAGPADPWLDLQGGGEPRQQCSGRRCSPTSWWSTASATPPRTRPATVTKRFDYLPFAENVNNLLAEWDRPGMRLVRAADGVRQRRRATGRY